MPDPADTTYHERHAACPRCGSNSIEHTLRGCLGPDTNRAICRAEGCGWTGIVDELVPSRSPSAVAQRLLQEEAWPGQREADLRAGAAALLVQQITALELGALYRRSRGIGCFDPPAWLLPPAPAKV